MSQTEANRARPNRRQSERTRDSRPLAFVVDSEREQITKGAFAIDLSQLGARIRTGVNLQPGQSITVIPAGGRGAPVPSRVIWVSEPDPTQDCEAGIAFLHHLPVGF